MVPNVAGTGTSFMGAAFYYLHDKRQDGESERLTSERVAWSTTRNLATDDPELAWKIMAATALDQERLKAEAGVKNTGRKSAASVYAYSIAWHPDEDGSISRAEMLRAADETIRALGAEDRQAIIVAHSDEPHPHVHVIVNRVSPTDGRMLGTSNDFHKLDAWALAYRRERGEEHLYCPARAEKAEAKRKRAAGETPEFVRGEKSTPRGMEADFSAARSANDNSAVKERERQKTLNRALAQDGRDMHARQRRDWAELSDRYKVRRNEVRTHAGAAIGRAKTAIADQFRPSWRSLYRRQAAEQSTFDERETRLSGKISNALDAIAHRRQLDPDSSRGMLSAAMNYLTSRPAREEALRRLHALQKRDLSQGQRLELDQAIGAIKSDRSALLSQAKIVFNADRAALIERQAIEQEALKSRWATRRQEMRRAFDAIGREAVAKRDAQQEQSPREKARQHDRREAFRAASEGRRKRTRTRRRSIRDDESGG